MKFSTKKKKKQKMCDQCCKIFFHESDVQQHMKSHCHPNSGAINVKNVISINHNSPGILRCVAITLKFMVHIVIDSSKTDFISKNMSIPNMQCLRTGNTSVIYVSQSQNSNIEPHYGNITTDITRKILFEMYFYEVQFTIKYTLKVISDAYQKLTFINIMYRHTIH